MANSKGTNPGNSGIAKPRAVEANVHRLDRSPPIANERPATAEAPRPEDRKPEPVPSEEARGRYVAASAPAPKKSWRRTLMFALLPVALIAGGYFYVTGGAVMSTDNAYVQADMVGLSTDVAGIVTEALVHDNQKVAKGDILIVVNQGFRNDAGDVGRQSDHVGLHIGIVGRHDRTACHIEISARDKRYRQ